MALLQQRKIECVFGAPGNPWELVTPHGLQAPNGTGILPTKADPLAVEIEFATETVSIPARSCVVTAIDTVNVTLRLPPVASWPVAPLSATVWLHVERVHSYVGYYDSAQPAIPRMPGGGGGAPVPSAPGTTFYVDQAVGNDTWPGSRAYPVATIAAALILAGTTGAPCRIEIDPGVYAEPIAMFTGLTVRGSAPGVVITPVGVDCIVRGAGVGACSIENLRVAASGGGGFAAVHDLGAVGTLLDVSECYLEAAAADFAILTAGQNARFFDCDIKGAVLHTGDGCFLQHCRQAVDIPIPALLNLAGANLDMKDVSVFNANAGAGAHAIQDDAGPSTRIDNCVILTNGGSALDTLNAANTTLVFNRLAGTAADITVDAASTLLMGMNQYDPTAAVIAGTLTLIQDSSDLGTSQLNVANWAAPTPPTNMLTAIDRMATLLVTLNLAVPIP